MRTNICVLFMLKQVLMFKIQAVKINILFEFGHKACKKEKGLIRIAASPRNCKWRLCT